MIAPPPFTGRANELETLVRALERCPVVVVRGPVGAGKTRLAEELVHRARTTTLLMAPMMVTMIRCEPRDRGMALSARAERAMDLMPGCLGKALAEEARLLIIDDAHHLGEEDAAQTLAACLPGPGARGRLVLITRDTLPLRRDAERTEITLGGLDAAAARELWSHLEETYRPTRHGACDEALTLTRGMPLALRREYARAAFGPDSPADTSTEAAAMSAGAGASAGTATGNLAGADAELSGDMGDAWSLATLPADARRALEAIAVLRLPAAPAAVAALAPAIAVEPALFELAARQLIDPLDDGRFRIHDVVRDDVLAAIAPAARRSLETLAAELVLALGRGQPEAPRPAWNAGDDGALGHLDVVDRLREAVWHHLAAGNRERAAQLVTRDHEISMRRGGGGEILALIEALRTAREPGERGRHSDGDDHGDSDRELALVQAAIAARHGRIAEALELAGSAAPGITPQAPIDPVAGAPAATPVPGAGFDAVDTAWLRFRAGDTAAARRTLGELLGSSRADVRCRAAAMLTEIELHAGNPAAAEALAVGAFERDRAAVSETTRARLHMALGAIEEHAGRIAAARAALSRAASAGRIDPALAAAIEARRSVHLAREGRVSEAEIALAEAERAACEIDAVAVADEIRRCRSLVALRRGELRRATDSLRELVSARRQRGDEIGALCAEIDLARVLVRRGELSGAAELVAACQASAARHQLVALVHAAELLGAAIDLAELRLDSAVRELGRLAGEACAGAEIRAEAERLLACARAQAGEPGAPGRIPAPGTGAALPLAMHSDSELFDSIDTGLFLARLALAGGDAARALELAGTTAVRAERAGRLADLADALASSARLLMARGDSEQARAAASRAVHEARTSGAIRAEVQARLVLAALARESDGAQTALEHAREAASLAASAGLAMERLIAAEAIAVIAGSGAGCHAEAAAVRAAAAATMPAAARDAAARVLGDLGLIAERPFRVITAGGGENLVANVSPQALRDRSLAIDGVAESIVRHGTPIADLRRRTLLKRLLYMFASAPGQSFSKEDIVQKVWNVDYHPLRHDAALFTNIMRLRRILGEDGADLIRVSEDGYRFVPPADFVFVTAAAG